MVLVGMWYPYRPADNEVVNTALLVTTVVGFLLGMYVLKILRSISCYTNHSGGMWYDVVGI